jgi:hypothetical protein
MTKNDMLKLTSRNVKFSFSSQNGLKFFHQFKNAYKNERKKKKQFLRNLELETFQL